jgi:ankyrin repeat protein
MNAKVVGHADVKTAVLLALLAREHVYIEGPPGVGKTMMAEVAATSLSLSPFIYQMHRDTRLQELVGSAIIFREPTVDGGEVIRQRVLPGGILKCGVCVLDDISRAPGEALNVLLRILNERKFGSEPIPLVTAIATGNPGGDGYYTEPLDPATLDRFTLQVKAEGLIARQSWDEARTVISLYANKERCRAGSAAPAPAPVDAASAAAGGASGAGGSAAVPIVTEPIAAGDVHAACQAADAVQHGRSVTDSDDFHAACHAADAVQIPVPVQRSLIRILRVLAERQGLSEHTSLLTDRTFLVKATKVIRSHALLHGRSVADSDDLHALRYLTTFRLPPAMHKKVPSIISAIVDGIPDAQLPAAEQNIGGNGGARGGAGVDVAGFNHDAADGPTEEHNNHDAAGSPTEEHGVRRSTIPTTPALSVARSDDSRVALRVLIGTEQAAQAASEARDITNRTALMVAAEEGDLAAVAALLEDARHLPSSLEARDAAGATAVVLAAMVPHNTAVVGMLLDAGCNIEGGSGASSGTALIAAARNDDVELVAALLAPRRKVDVEAVDGTEATALIHAAECGAVGAIQMLLVGGPDPAGGPPAHLEATTELGSTALLVAAANGQHQVVGLLLERDARLDAVDDAGCTALIVAAQAGHTRTVELLLAAGGPHSAACDYGRTALIWAADTGHLQCVLVLLGAGADTAASDLGGDTAFVRAEYRGHPAIAAAVAAAHSLRAPTSPL